MKEKTKINKAVKLFDEIVKLFPINYISINIFQLDLVDKLNSKKWYTKTESNDKGEYLVVKHIKKNITLFGKTKKIKNENTKK